MQRHQPLEPLDDAVHRALVGVAALGGPQPHRAREDRQEAVAADQLRGAVRRQQRRQRQQRLAVVGQAQVVAARVEGLPTEQPAHREADGDAERDLADDVPADPRADVQDREAAGQQQQGQVHEGERQPVVEARLGGEGEADVVVLGRDSRRPRRSSMSSVSGSPTWTSEASTGSVGASTAPSSRATAGASPATHQPSTATPRMVSGIVTPSSRHTGRPGAPRPPRPQVEGALDGQADAHQRHEHGELGDVGDQRRGGPAGRG